MVKICWSPPINPSLSRRQLPHPSKAALLHYYLPFSKFKIERIRITENPNHHHQSPKNKHMSMIALIVSALLLPCAGMTVVFLVYLFLLWFAARNEPIAQLPEKPLSNKGLSTEELQKLPKTTAGVDKLTGNECAVCLDEIESGQPGRLLPGCDHGFHLHCADTWLSQNSICPLCRASIQPDQIPPYLTDHDNPC